MVGGGGRCRGKRAHCNNRRHGLASDNVFRCVMPQMGGGCGCREMEVGDRQDRERGAEGAGEHGEGGVGWGAGEQLNKKGQGEEDAAT